MVTKLDILQELTEIRQSLRNQYLQNNGAEKSVMTLLNTDTVAQLNQLIVKVNADCLVEAKLLNKIYYIKAIT